MRLKLSLVLSVIIIIFSIVYIIDLLRQDFVFNRESTYESLVTVWTTTPGLSTTLEGINEVEHVKVSVKQFHNFESLQEALELAQINHALPDVVEVDSHYGMHEVMENFSPFPVENNLKNDSEFHLSIYDSFQDQDLLYAYPLGMEIPLLYLSQSIIQNDLDVDPYPFQTVEKLSNYKLIQDKIDDRNLSGDFWFFHIDQNIPWYWNAYQFSNPQDDKLTFEEVWKNLTIDFEMIPLLDHHRAITRFTNLEIGALITSSKHLLTVQRLIGNDFEFEVQPFIAKEGDDILVGGNGLVMLSENPSIPKLLEYLNDPDIQLELLSKTGWLPTQSELLENSTFIHRLPMSKYLNKLIVYEEDFVGEKFNGNSREKWMEKINQAHNIEIMN